MKQPWYSISTPPPWRVHVEILVNGFSFTGARGENPRDPNSPLWIEVKGVHKSVFVASEINRALNSGEGQWRPLKPGSWQAPLPEPVRSVEPVMAKINRYRYQAVEDAEAADLARENERERDFAKRNTANDDTPRKVFETSWWKDHSQIRYEPQGETTLRMIEGRLMRALSCAGVAARRSGAIRTAVLLYDIGEAAARRLAESEAKSTPNYIPSLELLPADQNDWLTAMDWFAALNPPVLVWSPRKRILPRDAWDNLNPAQQVLICRAGTIPMSFAEIGREQNWKGHQRAKQVFDQAISDCWRRSNNLPARKGLAAPDRVGELKQRNRRAKMETARHG